MVGLGRYIPRIQQVNAEVDINIVAATGLYTYDEIPHYFSYRGPGMLFDMPEPMTEMFVRDIEEGIGGTGIKAAFLKCVVEERGLTRDQTRVAKAIAAAHRLTGAPITVHTNAAHQTGRAALELFRAEDVDLSKVVVGHAGDSNDLDYLRWIADQGAIIGCDRFGIDVSIRAPTGSKHSQRCVIKATPTASCSRRTPPATWITSPERRCRNRYVRRCRTGITCTFPRTCCQLSRSAGSATSRSERC